MTILVTGGAGFVASPLLDRLLKRGESVLVLDNLCRGSLANICAKFNHSNFYFAEVNLADLEALRRVVRSHGKLGPITQVWHLAANSDIPAGTADTDVDLRDTFMTTFNTLKIMEEDKIRCLLFASSSAIYGDLGRRELTEDTGPLFPISNYGAMKLASEAAITAALERFLERAFIFRFPNVVGVPATHGVILDFLRRLRDEPSFLKVLGDGTQQKSYLHVSDLVDAMLFIQARAQSKLAVFNIGPVDSGITVRQIAEETAAVVSPNAVLRFGVGNKGWIGDVPVFRYSVTQLLTLGWKPKLDSLGAIRRAIKEIAQQEGLL